MKSPVRFECNYDRLVPINQVYDGRFYVREVENLAPLKKSILEVGLRRAPVVTPRGRKRFETVSGHRRNHSLRELGCKEIPIIIKRGDIRELAIEAVVENILSKSYNGIEEARSFQFFIAKCHMSTRGLADLTGVEHTTIVKTISLLKMDKRVQRMLVEGKLTKTHAEEIRSLPKLEQLEIAKHVAEENVQTTREYVKLWPNLSKKAKQLVFKHAISPLDIVSLASMLSHEEINTAILNHAKGKFNFKEAVMTRNLLPEEQAKGIIAGAAKGQIDLKRFITSAHGEASIALRKHYTETRDGQSLQALQPLPVSIELSTDDPIVGGDRLSNDSIEATKTRLLSMPPGTAELAKVGGEVVDVTEEESASLTIGNMHLQELTYDTAFRDFLRIFNVTCTKCKRSRSLFGAVDRKQLDKAKEALANITKRLERLD